MATAETRELIQVTSFYIIFIQASIDAFLALSAELNGPFQLFTFTWAREYMRLYMTLLRESVHYPHARPNPQEDEHFLAACLYLL